ncbi:hypothetical protein FNU79_08060 [Deinococcus detaillensis]|uniref:AraC family transcriptional regulator n=1 Tax=Deinococcus detaillensis TaxID=2592048 RepID=A0A553V0X8_9DEIO|nr:hypothetical protein [Deinococcus detaillensis]TSA86129.1 hypothetical protein FNU79_08060 [Deinococcus detaillensis]
MPSLPPHPPAALNVLRLAKVTPDVAVWLPATNLRALHLTRPTSGAAGGAVICSEGELLIDFEGGAFLHLRQGEACALPSAHRLLPARGTCTVLLVAQGT